MANARSISLTSCILFSLVFAGPCLAEGFNFSGNLAVSTDYVWRGKSQTQNSPALSGGLDLGYEYTQDHTVYVGVWGSNVDFDDSGFDSDTSFEVDFYAGLTGVIPVGNGLAWDVGWLRYEYPGDTRFNYNEAYGGLSYSPLNGLTLSGMYYYGLKIEHRHPGNYVDLNINSTPLAWLKEDSVMAPVKDLELILHAGYYDQQNANHSDEYWDWKFAVAKPIWRLNLELAYTDSDINVDSQDDAHLMFTVSTGF